MLQTSTRLGLDGDAFVAQRQQRISVVLNTIVEGTGGQRIVCECAQNHQLGIRRCRRVRSIVDGIRERLLRGEAVADYGILRKDVANKSGQRHSDRVFDRNALNAHCGHRVDVLVTVGTKVPHEGRVHLSDQAAIAAAALTLQRGHEHLNAEVRDM